MKSRGRLRRLTLFGAAYSVQGAVLTCLSTFDAPCLRTFGLSFTRIGSVGGITLIPFVLRMFIGLLSDQVNLIALGHRKPFVILGPLTQTAAFLIFPALSPSCLGSRQSICRSRCK